MYCHALQFFFFLMLDKEKETWHMEKVHLHMLIHMKQDWHGIIASMICISIVIAQKKKKKFEVLRFLNLV